MKSYQNGSSEGASLLQNSGDSTDKKKESTLFPIAKQLLGVLLGLVLGLALASHHDDAAQLRSADLSPPVSPATSEATSMVIPPEKSKYSHFQALNYRLYTGGAPLEYVNTTIENEECSDHTYDGIMNGAKYCYMGHRNFRKDVHARLAIMEEAVEKAYEESTKDSNTLKVFVAPEFFFRGRNGAYMLKQGQEFIFLDHDNQCEAEVCEILMGLEKLTADKRFEDWLFLMGTTVVAENLPVEDRYDFLFYNFAMMYKGYDPEKETHIGKRFLIPKRYVSSLDFLTPNRFGDKNHTKEIYETALSQQQDASDMVLNPHDMERKQYDRKLWNLYKHEVEKLDYVMIEYGWFMMDGITFSVEICLDHDLRVALTAFLADAALKEATLIPSSRDGVVEYVEIPKHQAQLSLVSSAGMVASAASIVLVDQGSLILQDGLNGDEEPEMEWEYACFKYGWGFGGGSEVLQRNASVTPTEVVFHYKMQEDVKHSIYEGDWKDRLRGVFTTAMYEPMIIVHEPAPIAPVY